MNVNEVIKELNARGITAELKTVMRNGKESRCITVGSGKVVPCVHLDNVEGMDVDEIVDICIYALNSRPDVDLDAIDREMVHANIRLGICPVGTQNEAILCRPTWLEDIDQYLYMEIVKDGYASISGEFLDHAGVSEEEAWQWAKENTYADSVLKNMTDVLEELTGIRSEEVHMYVVSTNACTRGAAAILNPKMTEQAAEICRCDEFYIIPSSIHECLLIPVDGTSQEEVDAMIKDVNETQVEPRDFLGSRSYIVRVNR